jgi:HSP20 family protein
MTFNPFRREGNFSIGDLQQEINAAFDRLWHTGLSTGPLDGQKWAPAIDVLEEPERLLIHVEVPGMDAADIDVSACDGALQIQGIREADAAQEEKRRFIKRERRFGRFSRRIDLPDSADFTKISASCRNGVLEIAVQKKAEAKAKSVRIDVSE